MCCGDLPASDFSYLQKLLKNPGGVSSCCDKRYFNETIPANFLIQEWIFMAPDDVKGVPKMIDIYSCN
jgi:hypothetical protein